MSLLAHSQPDGKRSWLVAITGTLGMIFTFGTPMSYGILREPLSQEFGISPIALSVIFSVMLFAFFIGSGVIGIFALRVPSRWMILAAAAASIIIAPMLYLTDSYFGLLLVFMILGLSVGTVFVMLASVVPRWFEKYQGTATGLIFVGNGLGLFLLPPAWQVTIAQFGIRFAFFVTMIFTGVTFLLAGTLCCRPTWVAKSTRDSSETAQWLTGLISSRQFRALFIGIGLAFGWYQLLAAYAVDLFLYRGFGDTMASALFGFIGGISIFSRIGGGYIADIIGAKEAFLLSLGCSSIGILLLLSAQTPILLLSIFLIGIGLGGSAAIYIPLLMQIYNPKHDSAIVGVFNISGGIGALTMPLIGTASIAYTESYTVAIFLTFIVIFCSLGMVQVGIE